MGCWIETVSAPGGVMTDHHGCSRWGDASVPGRAVARERRRETVGGHSRRGGVGRWRATEGAAGGATAGGCGGQSRQGPRAPGRASRWQSQRSHCAEQRPGGTRPQTAPALPRSSAPLSQTGARPGVLPGLPFPSALRAAAAGSCTQAVCKAMECGAPAVAPAAALRSALRSQPHRSAAAPRTAAAGGALRLDRLGGACLEGGHRHPGGNQEFLSAVLQSSCWERGTNLPSLECPPGCTT